MANKASRNFQKKIGFKLEKGITRKKMVSYAINNKKILPPKDVSPENWLKNRLKAYSQTVKETKFETYFENNLSVKISFLSEKEKKEVVDLIEYNLDKEKEEVKVASLPKPNKNLEKSKSGKEITEIKRKKKLDTVEENQPEKKTTIKADNIS